MQNREQMVDNAMQVCDLQNFIITQMKARQQEPVEDMISDIVHATLEDGSKLEFGEEVSLIRAMIIAGHDTPATDIGKLLFVLATQPEIAKTLRESVADDRLMNTLVAEMLRVAARVRGLGKRLS